MQLSLIPWSKKSKNSKIICVIVKEVKFSAFTTKKLSV